MPTQYITAPWAPPTPTGCMSPGTTLCHFLSSNCKSLCVKTQGNLLLRGIYMCILQLQSMFKLLTYKFPAISSKFQQAITLSPAQQVQPSVASHSAIFVLGDTASYVIYQSNHNSKDPVPTHTNRKKSGARQDTRYPQCYYYYLDKIAGTHILPVTIKVINACFFEACLKVNYADYF